MAAIAHRQRSPARSAVAAVMLAGAIACNAKGDVATPAASGPIAAASPAPAPSGKLRIVEPPAGSVDSIVRDALAGARAEGRTLVVYVGATWCEPCQSFHHAAERGELDATFPRLTLLAFDLDRDRERLVAAGYTSKYIPLFALPGPDGAASGKQIEGGIKGEGVIAFLSTRLRQMLAE
jgi:thiol-disulfide isomerase/thioredoxin